MGAKRVFMKFHSEQVVDTEDTAYHLFCVKGMPELDVCKSC